MLFHSPNLNEMLGLTDKRFSMVTILKGFTQINYFHYVKILASVMISQNGILCPFGLGIEGAL